MTQRQEYNHGQGEQVTMRRAFTLIELLVVVAIIALLLAILLPSLASARESGRSSVCLANLRQIFTACRVYADTQRGFGPAIGEPYAALPNWALQVQAYYTTHKSTGNNLYSPRSVLVCPTIRSSYGGAMLRTYAMNTTGHAGLSADPSGAWPADPDSYDDPAHSAHIRFDAVSQPSRTALAVDSARAPIAGSGPPSVRTTSMIDFRQADHVLNRLAKLHRMGKAFNTSLLDGSVLTLSEVQRPWAHPLP